MIKKNAIIKTIGKIKEGEMPWTKKKTELFLYILGLVLNKVEEDSYKNKKKKKIQNKKRFVEKIINIYISDPLE
jgi:predicted nucleic acid-binding protein